MEYILFAGLVYVIFVIYIEILNDKFIYPSHYNNLFVKLIPHIIAIVSLTLNIMLLKF